ncbi:MAG TPA: S41 family peptidase [Steroidobacteraceae bacterium]|nr:S41 family peptidase [Steroidobacteraceae bacterium]
MKRLAVLCLAVANLGADDPPLNPAALDRVSGFEGASGPKLPEPWYSPGAASLDHNSAHSGGAAARIDRDASSPGEFTPIAMTIPVDFSGAVVELCEVPRAVPAATVLDTDTEFATGSSIDSSRFTVQQVDNLAVLARVWGFLKYHHPRVARGELHWDFELFRVLPGILKASDAAARNAVLLAWTRKIGEPEPCDPCATVPQDAQLFADLEWIHDRENLGDELSRYLEDVYRNRAAGEEQFFVVPGTNSGKAVFENEPAYESFETPDTGYRVLALFRYWNIIEYWFPYRDVIGTSWPDVLREFVPKLAAASSRLEYGLALSKLVARVQDSHAVLADTDVLPPRGACQAPVDIRFVEGSATIVAYAHASKGPATELRTGDVIAAVDSVPVATLVTDRIRYYAGSNEARKLDWAAYLLLRGPCENVALDVVRAGERMEVEISRVPLAELEFAQAARHDRPGDTLQWLADDIAYIKLSTIDVADVGDYMERVQKARGLVIDIRAYPTNGVGPVLGGHLVPEPKEFAQLSGVDLRNPGTFPWTYKPRLDPVAPYFAGKVAILVDERTISQAEFTAMAFRTAPGAVVVGSATAGADGSMTTVPLPGGHATWISGVGVFYPDRSPTQRVGIVPDIVVTPTVAGIRDGRDEVIERAIREIMGGGS